MRDDGTLDDQQNPGVAAGRSDVTTSSERPATTTATDGTRPEYHRIPSPGGTTTRSGRLRNLLALGRFAAGPAAPGGPSRRPGRTAVALAAGVTCCLGLAALAQARQETGADTAARAAVADADLERRAAADAADAASRSLDRVSATTPSATVSPSATTADPDTTRAPAPRKQPARPADPAPVAGLTKVQMANAKVIVRTGRAMGVPRRGLVIAVATAMQESNLYNVASGVLPESQEYPHQGVGWDHDSVGLFQQRASSGWGEVGQLMDPAFATRQFLAALQQIPGWRDLPLTVAAQAVQISAYPDLYAQHEWRAAKVVDAHLAAVK
ncbi:peptidase M23 [Micromonospora rubida]|uniref:peptidase M23 n=1 Tax=Micromonospora rubida TaxID=2697657 RepID=UPI001377BE69|nr:peptidase M23 [Micromonospora rubida]NBE84244.1 peptidase M23 [Micromonospora rubida]